MRDSVFIKNMKAAFSEKLPETKLFAYEAVDSTNTEAKLYASAAEDKRAFFVAEEQRAGRGRKGRSFSSDKGGLYLSYSFSPSLECSEAIKLTLFAAVALCETVFEFTGVMPKIKWVNDVFLGGKKLAGILTEGEFSDNGSDFKYAVVGIGVNLLKGNFEGDLEKIATDLESETKVRVDIAEFAASLARRLTQFESVPKEEYIKKYKELSVATGKVVTVKSPEGSYKAKALDVMDNGALLVELDGGERRELFSAEISIDV